MVCTPLHKIFPTVKKLRKIVQSTFQKWKWQFLLFSVILTEIQLQFAISSCKKGMHNLSFIILTPRDFICRLKVTTQSNWLFVWWIDWLSDWLIDFLIDWLIVWLSNWLIEWVSDWLIDWLADWLIEWLIDWLTNQLSDCFTHSLIHALSVGHNWLTDYLTEWLIHWLIEIKTDSFLKHDAYIRYLRYLAGQKLLKTSSLSGSKTLKLTAQLSGGRGDNAWKQAKLFSQPISSENDFTFEITITLRVP